MTKNIVELSEAVEMIIDCFYCDETLRDVGVDVYDVAEIADEEGWTVGATGKVKCPKCTQKMKKND